MKPQNKDLLWSFITTLLTLVVGFLWCWFLFVQPPDHSSEAQARMEIDGLRKQNKQLQIEVAEKVGEIASLRGWTEFDSTKKLVGQKRR